MSSRSSSRSLSRRRNRIASEPSSSVVLRLAAFQRAFQEIMAPCLDQPWCIEATRIAQLALTELGVSATPVFTRLRVMNAASLREEYGRETVVPNRQRPAMTRFGWRELGPFPDGEVGFSGHLAVLAAGHLFDGAIAQCHSPARGLWTPSTILSPRDFLKSGKGTLFLPHDGAETGIEYERVAANAFVYTAPVWTAPHVRGMAAAIARRTNCLLSRAQAAVPERRSA